MFSASGNLDSVGMPGEVLTQALTKVPYRSASSASRLKGPVTCRTYLCSSSKTCRNICGHVSHVIFSLSFSLTLSGSPSLSHSPALSLSLLTLTLTLTLSESLSHSAALSLSLSLFSSQSHSHPSLLAPRSHSHSLSLFLSQSGLKQTGVHLSRGKGGLSRQDCRPPTWAEEQAGKRTCWKFGTPGE